MPEIHQVLGGGEIVYGGASVQNDPGGRSGELVMGTSQTNGCSAFRLVLHDLNFRPTAARVTRYTVTGMSRDKCAGDRVCYQDGLLDQPIPFTPPQANQFGHYFFNAGGHDNAVLTRLLTLCGCGTGKVRSVCIEVQVEVLPAPNPPVDMIFQFCYECVLAQR